jgi:hypothetical protein
LLINLFRLGIYFSIETKLTSEVNINTNTISTTNNTNSTGNIENNNNNPPDTIDIASLSNQQKQQLLSKKFDSFNCSPYIPKSYLFSSQNILNFLILKCMFLNSPHPNIISLISLSIYSYFSQNILNFLILNVFYS